jgi:hypothetical protein
VTDFRAAHSDTLPEQLRTGATTEGMGKIFGDPERPAQAAKAVTGRAEHSRTRLDELAAHSGVPRFDAPGSQSAPHRRSGASEAVGGGYSACLFWAFVIGGASQRADARIVGAAVSLLGV